MVGVAMLGASPLSPALLVLNIRCYAAAAERNTNGGGDSDDGRYPALQVSGVQVTLSLRLLIKHYAMNANMGVDE
jgi:hypothetical protein